MTIQEKLIEKLSALGEKEIHSKSHKYRTFTRTVNIKTKEPLPVEKMGCFYFLGKAGALRYGRNSSGSIAIDHIKKFLLGDAQ